MNKIAIVIGNGFDLNLMLKTSYSDFARSKEFNNLSQTYLFKSYVNTSNTDQSLYAYLQSVFNCQNWFDIEEEIYSYASNCNHITKILSTEFDYIKNALQQYLIRIVGITSPCHDSLAYQFMNDVLKNEDLEINIFSFNYTNCLTLCDCKLRKGVNFYNIHGDLDSDIVLGYYDYRHKLSDNDFSFMDKSFMLKDAGFGIGARLCEANEVIFFGHSLNPMDFSFFKSYFDSVVKTSLNRSLTFICLDEKSILGIKIALKIQGYDIRSLYENLDNVDFIRTHNWNERSEDDVTKYNQLRQRLINLQAK